MTSAEQEVYDFVVECNGKAPMDQVQARFNHRFDRTELLRILTSMTGNGILVWNAVNEFYSLPQKERAEHNFSHLFEPPPGKIAVLADDTQEMKIGSLYVIRFGSATAGTVCATYASFESPEGLGTVECFWQVGDRVLFGPNAGMSFTMDVSGSRRTFRVMGEKEILTRVKQSAQELAEKAVEVE